MSTKSSTVAVTAWNWVIQSLAKFKQVDSSTLVGLVKKAPAISNDLGKDAREMLSLRILESLFMHGSEATVDTDPAQNAKISFDPSENCEDVLHKILEETSEPMNKLERQKWNVRPFIMLKRSSLPKSPFQKFKEALLEGSHPLLSPLRELSKVEPANTSQNTSYVADVNSDAQTTIAEDNLASLNPANENIKLQERQLQKSNEVENFTRAIAEHVGRKEHKIESRFEHTASKKLEQSCGNANTDQCQQQPPNDDDDVPQDTYTEGQDKWVAIDSMEVLEFGGESKDRKNDTPPNVSNSEPKNSMENGSQLKTASNSERSDDERTDSESEDERIDIAAKKEAFLSSQCTLSQDSMAMNDYAEICLCMKCNKGGQLLVCRSNACPFRVHESCMGSTATLDENGKFFCPFCAYSRAISKYLLVKKKASLARKDLQSFLSLEVKHRQKIFSKKGAVLEKDESRQIGASDENFVLSGKEDCAPAEPSCEEETACVRNAENSILAEPSRSRVNNELDCGDKGVSVGIGSLKKGGEAEKKVGEASHSLTRMEAHEVGENAAIHSNNGCLVQPVCQIRIPKVQINEKESLASVVRSHSRRSCKRKSQCTSPPIPLLGRKKLQWSKSEEETLKEGVLKFSSVGDKRIPWREILSFGQDVFHKSRTAIDLKDKWRNMCKGSPAAKKRKL